MHGLAIPKRVKLAIERLSKYQIGERVPVSAMPHHTVPWLVELGYLTPRKIYTLPHYQLPTTISLVCGCGVNYYYYAGVPSQNSQAADQIQA